MLRVMIVDDEALARQALRQLLEEIPGVELLGEAENVSTALEKIRESAPDVLLLDIRMPRADGFALLRQLTEPPLVIFVTAYSEYAVQAFEVAAVDYVLKPVLKPRLQQALDRAREALGQSAATAPLSESDRLCLRTPERTLITPQEKLLLLEAEGDFTRVTVVGEAPLLICHPLGHYERSLPNPPFCRLDRSLMVNLDRVAAIEISPTRGARLTLAELRRPVELGRAALKRLREALPQIAEVPGAG